jgi:hypothetical protein
MDNLKNFLHKIGDLNILNTFTNARSRLELGGLINIINYRIKKIINNNSSSIEDNSIILLILNIIIRIFKNTHLILDFKNYDKTLILTNKHYCNVDKYNEYMNNIFEKSLHNIKPNYSYIDINISSGGNAGFIGFGVIDVLKHVQKMHNIVIDRISGISFGSIIGFFYLIEMPTSIVINIYMQMFEIFKNNDNITQIESFYSLWMHYLKDIIDPNAYKKCNNKLYILYGVLKHSGLEYKLKSNYKSNNDVFLTCMASSSIPFITLNGSCLKIDDDYTIDVGLIKNIYSFGNKTEMNINFSEYHCLPSQLVMPTNEKIEDYIFEGVKEAIKFFETGKSSLIYIEEFKNEESFLEKL